MKKIIFTGLLLSLVIVVKAQTGVPNGNFEKWDTTEVYSNPNYYSSSNTELYMIATLSNVNHSTDKQHGTYAARMESSNNFPGYILTNKEGITGDLTSGGFPYSQMVDSMTGYFKYHAAGGDTAMIIVLFKKNSIPISYTICRFYGNATSYSRFSFHINQPGLPVTPDSCIIGFFSSNAFDMSSVNNGNWLLVDNIAFVKKSGTAAAIPNYDFENWTPTGFSNPDGWTSLNTFSFLFGFPPNVIPVSPGHTGKYAVNIKTQALNFGGSYDTMGFVTTGSFGSSTPQGGFPMSTKPDSIGFYYKYNNSFNTKDSAVFAIMFSKWSNSTHLTATVDSYFVRLGAATNWKFITIPFVDLTGKPFDTANIGVLSSDFADSADFHPGVGNNITVDDITFYYNGVGIAAGFVIRDLKIFPNPASEQINFELTIDKPKENLAVSIFDMSGKIVQTKQISSLVSGQNNVSVDLNSLSTGNYVIVLTSENRTLFSKKFSISR